MTADVVQQKHINNKCYIYAFRYTEIEWGDHSCTLTQATFSNRHTRQLTWWTNTDSLDGHHSTIHTSLL